MVHADYQGGGLVNLVSSLVAARGGETDYAPLTLLPPEALAGRRHLVLLVADGLGYHYLSRHHGILRGHLKGRLTSVFPPTTATAITTFLTGLAPAQHGLSGWFVHFRELGGVLAVLPFRYRSGAGFPADTVSAEALFGHTPLFDRIATRSVVVSPEYMAHSDFNRSHSGSAAQRPYRGMAEMFERVLTALRAPEPSLIYAYWPELDSLAHEHGVAGAALEQGFQELDEAVGGFLERAAGLDATLIVTADHGLIDTTPGRTIQLADHPDLERCLVLPLCGEPRTAYCYVHPDRGDRFEGYVKERLGHCAELHRSSELIEAGWFGPGEPHPRLAERIGHYTLVMKENWTIKDRLLGEAEFHHIGVHGGVSEEEMWVPLVVVDL